MAYWSYILVSLLVISTFFCFESVSGAYCNGISCGCNVFTSFETSLLLKFKASQNDPKGVFSTWKKGVGCRKGWNGVCCDGTGKVSDIYLPSVGITGILGGYLANLTGLQHLTLSGNSLYGSISPAFGNISTLVTLDLSYNKLSGPIPTTLSNAGNLSYLNLNNNYLKGDVPPSLDSFCSLGFFNFASNCLNPTSNTSYCTADTQNTKAVCTAFYNAPPLRSPPSPPPAHSPPPPPAGHKKKSPPPAKKSPPPKKKSPPPHKKSPPPKKKSPPPKRKSPPPKRKSPPPPRRTM